MWNLGIEELEKQGGTRREKKRKASLTGIREKLWMRNKFKMVAQIREENGVIFGNCDL
jgi:hypothetical protein